MPRSERTETMTQPHSTMKTLLLGLGAALLATACTLSFDPNGSGGEDGGDDAQCLDLFETCVDLAGESPGCEAVFEFCAGSGSDDGGETPQPGCEEDYIDCLTEGVPPEACEPLLWECEPGGDDDGGMCDDPNGCEPPQPCEDPNDPACQPPTDCDDLLQTCVELTGQEEACQELLPACWANDCDALLNGCYSLGGLDGLCEELTGCYGDQPQPPADDCQELIQECISEGESPDICEEIYAECFDVPTPPEPGNCEWYYGECFEQFNPGFCDQGGEACQVGLFPEQFECGLVFPDLCGGAEISDIGCSNAEQSCWDGFQNADLCADISLVQDPIAWLAQLAECNGWNEG